MKAALIALAVALVAVGVQQYRIAGLHTDIAERDTKIGALNGLIEKQNHANDKLALTGKLETTEAAGRVSDVLLNGERAKRNLPKGTGPKVMNQFMREVFQ